MKWYYVLKNGKVAKLVSEANLPFRGATAEALIDAGRQVAETDIDMLKIFRACGHSDELAAAHGVRPTPEDLILAQSSFSQGRIRAGFRLLGEEAVLDALIGSSPQMTADWRDEKTINIDDPRVVYALSQANPPIDINKVKLAILAAG